MWYRWRLTLQRQRKITHQKTKISMKEQASQPQAKRLTIHFYAAEFTQGQRRYIRRPLAI